jgi:hypothetical protein
LPCHCWSRDKSLPESQGSLDVLADRGELESEVVSPIAFGFIGRLFPTRIAAAIASAGIRTPEP